MRVDDNLRVNLAEVLHRSAQAHPTALCLVDGDRRITYRECATLVRELAGALQSLGLRKGDVVATCLPNSVEYVAAYFAIAQMGGVLVALNPRYRERELEYILGSAEAKVILTIPELGGFAHAAALRGLRPKLPALHTIVTVGGDGGSLTWEELLARGRGHPFDPVPVRPEKDLCLIVYTSGTTGPPKGAMQTHQNQVSCAANTADALRLTHADIVLAAIPLSHAFGMAPTLGATFLAGGAMVLMREFKPEEALALIEREKITIQHAVPTMVILELDAMERRPHNVSSLRTGIVGGAPMPPGLPERARRIMGWELGNCLGITECCVIALARTLDEEWVRDTTAGPLVKRMEAKVVDEAGRPVSPNQVGELCCRGPSVIPGYYKRPDLNAQQFDAEGWFRTGDMVKLDERGNLTVVGRKKEMIIRGGYNIFPDEIEELIRSHPGVRDCAVIGLPDPVLGEKICACVVFREGAELDLGRLRQHCLARGAADFKPPDVLHVIPHVPRTGIGKVQRVILRESVLKDLGLCES